ncbi:cysteine--tRNA ligase [Candidatus Peregrinibacteria bacterium]|nr:cysteine--tRNA ligase [Candidatus Peregrinibacteria bacterium]
MLKLFNTRTRRKNVFKPMKSGEVRMYSCGPTVYNFAHIGNFRAYLFSDLLHRYLTHFKGFNVRWVMNITDIDDKTIQASRKPGDPKANLREFTQKFEAEFLQDLRTLKIAENVSPDSAFAFYKMPRATEHIPEMQDLIVKIIKNGYGYVKDGSMYFNVLKYAKDHRYGRLLAIDLEQFQDGVRIDADEYSKENLKDFALWKEKKEDEPSWDFFFEGKNYAGRPGWHIECSAMSHTYLGDRFDIHTGGVDLKFPHHEDEIAQSVAGYCEDPVNFWCHNEHLLVDRKKMSKSLGNFFTLRDLVKKGIEPKYFRFLILSTHYRKRFHFTLKGVEAAKTAVSRMQETMYKLLELSEKGDGREIGKKKMADLLKKTHKAFGAALDDDLNTPQAVSALFDFLRKLNGLLADNAVSADGALAALSFFKKIDMIFSVFSFQKENLEDSVAQKIAQRNLARKNRDFLMADTIRDELKQQGIELEDTPDGTVWRRR